jgi:hypothetical protein
MPSGLGATGLENEKSWLNPFREELYKVKMLTYPLATNYKKKLSRAVKRQNRTRST